MPNTHQFVDWLTMESLRILLNKVQIAPFFNTSYNKEFQREFAVGEEVRVKMPHRFTIREGLGYNPQALSRQYTTVTVDQLFGVDFEWDSVEKALKMERSEADIRKEYIEPAMAQIANELDSRCALYALQNTPTLVGVLATNPTATSTYQGARTKLSQLSCPAGEKGMIISPAMMESLVTANSGLSGWFNPSDQISKAFKEGYIGRAAGFNWYESNNLWSHTAGTWASTVSVNGASQSGSSIALTATAGDTFKKGDIVTFALTYAVNPVNRRSLGFLKQFVVTADMTAVGSGNAADVLQIYPALTPSGSYQNVTVSPAHAAALVLLPGTTSPNGKVGISGLGIHGDAFALVGVELETPKAVELSSQTRDPETGIAIRFIRQFDGETSKMINRFDVLCGFGRLHAESCSVRVCSST